MGSPSWHATHAEMAASERGVRSMNQLDGFRALPERLSLDEKGELTVCLCQPRTGVLKVIELAANHGLNLSAAEVAEFIADVDQDGHTRDVLLGGSNANRTSNAILRLATSSTSRSDRDPLGSTDGLIVQSSWSSPSSGSPSVGCCLDLLRVQYDLIFRELPAIRRYCLWVPPARRHSECADSKFLTLCQ